MHKHVKILFQYDGPNPNQYELESMWAIPISDGYEIDNIPFYTLGIALKDVVSAEKDLDGILIFKALIRPSGHSTVRLWFTKDKISEIEPIRNQLQKMGCASELSDLPRLIAVDIPPLVDYKNIWEIFDKGEKEGLFEYEEACIGFLIPPATPLQTNEN